MTTWEDWAHSLGGGGAGYPLFVQLHHPWFSHAVLNLFYLWHLGIIIGRYSYNYVDSLIVDSLP